MTASKQSEKRIRVEFVQQPSSSPIKGTLLLNFQGHMVEMEDLHYSFTRDKICHVFRRFHNLGEVSCTPSSKEEGAEASLHAGAASSTVSSSFDITFHSFPVYPVMNNIFHHTGDPLASAFSCDTSRMSDPHAIRCIFTNLNRDGDTNMIKGTDSFNAHDNVKKYMTFVRSISIDLSIDLYRSISINIDLSIYLSIDVYPSIELYRSICLRVSRYLILSFYFHVLVVRWSMLSYM
jgi:hypothetical protein